MPILVRVPLIAPLTIIILAQEPLHRRDHVVMIVAMVQVDVPDRFVKLFLLPRIPYGSQVIVKHVQSYALFFQHLLKPFQFGNATATVQGHAGTMT